MSDYQCGTAYSFYYANEFLIGFYNGDIKSFEVSSELYKANSCTGVTKYIAVEDEPEATTYTAAMAMHNILPLVGMEFIDTNHSTNKPVIALVIDGENVIYKSLFNGSGRKYNSARLSSIKSITPPIELIDGKAYQFDVREKGGIVCGIYHEYDKKLHVGQAHYFDLLSATNIQLLEVTK